MKWNWANIYFLFLLSKDIRFLLPFTHPGMHPGPRKHHILSSPVLLHTIPLALPPYDAETSQNIASFVYLPWHLFHTPTSPPTLPCLQGAPSTLYPSSVFLRLVILVAPAWQWEPWGQGQSLILCYSLNKCLLNQIQNFAFTCKDNVKLYIQCITTDTCHSQ